MGREEKSGLLRMHKALCVGEMIFLQKEGAELMCDGWSYFLPTVMIRSICIPFGLNHSKMSVF